MNLANMAGRQQWHHTVALTEAQLIHCGQWGATAAPLWGPCVVVPKGTVELGVQHACAAVPYTHLPAHQTVLDTLLRPPP